MVTANGRGPCEEVIVDGELVIGMPEVTLPEPDAPAELEPQVDTDA